MINQALDLFGTPIVTPTPRATTIVYETKGRAREYCELSANLYTGCDHGCVYCYAPDVLQRNRSDFHSFVVPRTDIIHKLTQDAQSIQCRGETRQTLLCFACDPYCHANVAKKITSQAIKVLHHYGLPVCVLTKGGMRAYHDIHEFGPRDSFACTLTTLNPTESVKWEPRAALPADRIEALAEFHRRGIPTWVSLEPVLDPAWTLDIIRATHTVVDQYKIGVLNYHPKAATIDWSKFARNAVSLIESLGGRYYLKQDLRRHAPELPPTL